MTTVARLHEQQTQQASAPLSLPDVPDRPRTSASESSPAHKWLQNLRRPRSSQSSKPSTLRKRRPLLPHEEVRRDSALVSSSPTASTVSAAQDGSPTAQNQSPAAEQPLEVPTIVVQDEAPTKLSADRQSRQDHNFLSSARPISAPTSGTHDDPFRGITTDIPTGGFEDLFASSETMQFTKRGTMLLNGERVAEMLNQQDSNGPGTQSKAIPRSNTSQARNSRILSADDISLSQKVRSMYENGGENSLDLTDQTLVEEEEEGDHQPPQVSITPKQNGASSRTSTVAEKRQSLNVRQPYEVAGGIEDWADVDGGNVDRYGFIIQKKAESRASNYSGSPFDSPGSHRVTEALLEASANPRRNFSMRRAPSRARSERPDSRAHKGPGSIHSNMTNNTFSKASGTFRYAVNRLPQNKNRRWMDEAGDMLTPPPGLAQLAEEQDGGRVGMAMKKKEWQRERKWGKMGKANPRTAKGAGMQFDFDAKDHKVVSRTWKGIPDRWRASAWYSFLATSARKQKGAASEAELIQAFHELQKENSADDMQIDCDVPRTINSHIMFRRRYRGGQRLLFRVLHALSLYFPETGYVQGMAAIAATLLCYYDEENTFIMIVRLWQLRGLQKLYQDGFEGLMLALDDFKDNWLRGGEVAQKLDELAIPPTSYGTRWYLTLFNYSVPFPAQLRVWDVFMLLGDASNAIDPKLKAEFGADLDVLHATSAALIDATREILLDSDFENAMKVLTSWIPVKDEDMLMKVAFAEWKLRKKRS